MKKLDRFIDVHLLNRESCSPSLLQLTQLHSTALRLRPIITLTRSIALPLLLRLRLPQWQHTLPPNIARQPKPTITRIHSTVHLQQLHRLLPLHIRLHNIALLLRLTITHTHFIVHLWQRLHPQLPWVHTLLLSIAHQQWVTTIRTLSIAHQRLLQFQLHTRQLNTALPQKLTITHIVSIALPLLLFKHIQLHSTVHQPRPITTRLVSIALPQPLLVHTQQKDTVHQRWPIIT